MYLLLKTMSEIKSFPILRGITNIDLSKLGFDVDNFVNSYQTYAQFKESNIDEKRFFSFEEITRWVNYIYREYSSVHCSNPEHKYEEEMIAKDSIAEANKLFSIMKKYDLDFIVIV